MKRFEDATLGSGCPNNRFYNKIFIREKRMEHQSPKQDADMVTALRAYCEDACKPRFISKSLFFFVNCPTRDPRTRNEDGHGSET